ncbi:hypothetical protein FLP10_03365 [Agromyces intestinalis]|uniref:DUF2079 domain-containing protein n=1 Tax=Agromyces intestinalis TaxID=2592652 RepID=A0A5C1YBV1_9MICO|nr:DUF6541 family protein [Agromyces intestinalis]QEO13563.1 hypothetical protein FLP10_03365 [Agromyces intestinalis]
MILDWLAWVPVLLVALAWLWVPGLVLVSAVGARGFVLAAASPAVSTAVLAGIAVVAPRVGIPWTAPAVAGVVLAAGLIAWGARLLVMRRRRAAGGAPTGAETPDEPDADASVHAVGPRFSLGVVTSIVWALAAVVVTAQLIAVLGTPAAISQTFDNGFHLNVVRRIIDTYDGSSFSITGLLGVSSTYPAAWHDLTSLVAMTTGSSIPAAANAVDLAVAAVVWPGAILLLVRGILRRRSAVIVAGALAVALPWFPLLPLTFGVLFPYFLAIALLPIAVALGLSLLGRIGDLGLHVAVRAVLLVFALGALALSQPAVVFAAAALLVPATIPFVVEWWSRLTSAAARAALLVGYAAVLVGFLLAWVRIGRFGMSAPWGPSSGARGGAFDVLLVMRPGEPPSLALALGVLLGLVVIVWRRRRLLWLAGSWLIAAVLFYAAETVGAGDLRTLLLGLFYNDPPRLASLFVVACLPVAVVGFVGGWDSARRLLRGRVGPGVLAGCGIAAFVMVVILGQAAAMADGLSRARAAWSSTPPAPVVDDDELALIARLPQTTPPGAVLVGNPWTGTNLAYALAGRQVLNPHFNISPNADVLLLDARLREASTSDEVCEAVERTGVGYVLDFGSYFRDAAGLLKFDATASYPGLVGLDQADGFEEIDREGDAVLYRITACD